MNLQNYLHSNCQGRENAVKSKDLEVMFGVHGGHVRQMINTLRAQGVPICSSSQGYYYATTKADIKSTINHLSSRIKRIEDARDGMIQMLDNFTYDEEIKNDE